MKNQGTNKQSTAPDVESTHRLGAFKIELLSLINKHSIEKDDDAPDFILAEFILNCLNAFELATIDRTKWYCPNCKTKVDCSDVTFDGRHELCGGEVIYNDARLMYEADNRKGFEND